MPKVIIKGDKICCTKDYNNKFTLKLLSTCSKTQGK